ncbi:fibroblast growth factor 8-like isoform X2 [Anneissia japonica]|uniref:fibroblast growth factor 8-like isoform X2 n=1 Tax=Anneissia japonica TaxID=1529436 RepID=UPI00142573C5|nr:fibroblast growth factor 8-like isoform X2 [Anneissia japonica]
MNFHMLFHCVIVLSIQVTHQRVIGDAVQPESNANRSGKRLLIYSTMSYNFLRIAGKKNITASAKATDPYAVVITNTVKEGLTIMGEKSHLYLCILSKNGKMIAMSSPTSSTDRYYCYFREDVSQNDRTTYELAKRPDWSLIFSKDGSPRRAYSKRDNKKTGFMKLPVTTNGNQR